MTAILESLVAALQSEKESIEESEVHKLAILSLNFGAFAKSVEALQRILLCERSELLSGRANDDNHMGNAGLSLDKYRHDFIEQQSQIQDAMIEGIGNECTAILSELDDSEHLCPSNPAQQPHDCANRVMDYLKSVFERLSFMPRSLIEVCQFTSCRHIAQYMQSLLADGEGSINVLGVFNLNLDLVTLESRVDEFGTPDLG